MKKDNSGYPGYHELPDYLRTGEPGEHPRQTDRRTGWHPKRAHFHDYRAPGIYMITATAIRGSLPLSIIPPLSDSELKAGQQIRPINTPLGEAIRQELEALPRFHPELLAGELVIMPDHIHFMLHVKRRLKRMLGYELAGLFAACSKAQANLRLNMASSSSASSPSYSSSFSSHYFSHSSSSFSSSSFSDSAVSSSAVADFPLNEKLRTAEKIQTLFEPFHDRIIFNEQQYEKAVNYIRDNPRRLIIKKNHKDLFQRYLHLQVGDSLYAAFGNIFLLKEINLLPVRIHRRWSEREFAEYDARCRQQIDIGAIPISPAIHPAEKDIMNYGRKNGNGIIIIRDRCFPNRFKPAGEDFDLCSDGRLLILAPLVIAEGKSTLCRSDSGYSEFHQMNDIALEIAGLPASARLAIKNDGR